MRECPPPFPKSRVTYHVSPVTYHVSHVFFWQSGEAYRWRVCYQRGLPRLVFNQCHLQTNAAAWTQHKNVVWKITAALLSYDFCEYLFKYLLN